MSSFKLQYGDELRRVSKPPFQLSELKRITEVMFEVKDPVFLYEDEEKDTITVTTQAEYQAALDFAVGKTVKLFVTLETPQGLSDSFIPVDSKFSQLRSSLPTSFLAFNSQINRRQNLRIQKTSELVFIGAEDQNENLGKQVVPKASLAIDDELKRNIRETIREELSSVIIKPRQKSSEVFKFVCSACNSTPIVGVVYLCLKCPYSYWCDDCEAWGEHLHALIKVNDQSKLEQVDLHALKLMNSKPPMALAEPIVANPLMINEPLVPSAPLYTYLPTIAKKPDDSARLQRMAFMLEKLRVMGFETNKSVVDAILRNNYDLQSTIEDLLRN